MISTSLVYIEQDNSYLLLHRTKKKGDLNQGKWIGVGGKFEAGESPEDCMRRETMEETGLTVDEYRYRGIVTFVTLDENMKPDETEYMHLFHVTAFHGRLKECDEGFLEWVPKSRMNDLPHWKGDEIFLALLDKANEPFFSLKLVYRDGILVEAKLGEKILDVK